MGTVNSLTEAVAACYSSWEQLTVEVTGGTARGSSDSHRGYSSWEQLTVADAAGTVRGSSVGSRVADKRPVV